MATILGDIRTYLLADSGIAALVGTRVRPRQMAQGETMPAIRLNIVSGESDEHLGGESTISHPRVQIDAYGATPTAADELSDLIRIRLRGWRGAASNYFIHGVTALTFYQTDEPIDDASNRYRWISSRDYRISHSQAVS